MTLVSPGVSFRREALIILLSRPLLIKLKLTGNQDEKGQRVSPRGCLRGRAADGPIQKVVTRRQRDEIAGTGVAGFGARRGRRHASRGRIGGCGRKTGREDGESSCPEGS